MRREEIKKFCLRLYQSVCQSIKKDKNLQLAVVIGTMLLVGFTISQCSGTTEKVYVSSSEVDFKKGRLLTAQDANFYKKRDQLQVDKIRKVLEAQDAILERLKILEEKPSEKIESLPPTPNATETSSFQPMPIEPAVEPIRLHDSESFEVQKPDASTSGSPSRRSFEQVRPKVSAKPPEPGIAVVSFPVKKTKKLEIGITLPSGSFVKAKILTGVDAPQGKAYPSLLALDYAFIAPNNYRIDLSGCFVIAKAQGDLSTERVQMQPTRLSCVSKVGQMFEREVTGYVADQGDNNFALSGKLNSKQGRVMAMAFLSSVVEGIGNAVKQAQLTQSTNAVGGSTSVLTGDEGKYLAAGGASNAASQVTQWYLGQAQNLLPTINVGAGQDVWIVMTDKVELPNDYFTKNKRGRNDHSQMEYLSRLFN